MEEGKEKMKYIGIIFLYLLVNNFIFSKFLGLCPFLGVSKSSSSSLGMGAAVTFVTTITSILTYVVYYSLLVPFHLEYLKTIVFILLIASLVQFVEMFINKFSPSLYKALGIYLPLITTNCAVLGITLINIDEGYNLLGSALSGFAAGLGFTFAMIVMSSLRERLDDTPVRKSFKGIPITFISAGIMALSFMAFDSTLLVNLRLA